MEKHAEQQIKLKRNNLLFPKKNACYIIPCAKIILSMAHRKHFSTANKMVAKIY